MRFCRVADALAFAEHRLAAIREHISIRHSDVFRLLRHSGGLGQFDLVLAGGLFDYLSDRQVVFIMRSVFHSLLCPGGCFFFTNIARPNPYRPWMSYLADWHLIERSTEDILHLASEAGISDSIAIECDQTGLTLLVRITKPDATNGT